MGLLGSQSDPANEGIAITKKGRVLESNVRMAEIFGYEYEELIGFEVTKFIAPESMNLVMNNIKSEYDKPYLHYALRKDGTRIMVQVSGKTILYQGEILRFMIIKEIIQRNKMDESMILLLDDMPGIVIAADASKDLKITYFNKTFAKLVNEDIVGKPFCDTFIGQTQECCDPIGDKEACMKIIQEWIKSSELLFKTEHATIKISDGERKTSLSIVKIYYNSDPDELSGLVAIGN